MAAKSIVQFLTTGDLIGDLTLVKAETITKDVIALGETCCWLYLWLTQKLFFKNKGALCSNSAII